MRMLTAMHWGIYEAEPDGRGGARLHPFAHDPAPSSIGLHVLDEDVRRLRVRRPAIRKGWLDHGPGIASAKRGSEPFVEVEWKEALDLAAAEIRRVAERHGNKSIFAGSYGWASAGRFHHAQSQIHRFYNACGGYVRHVTSYSLGAAHTLLRHIVAPMDQMVLMHTAWDVIEANTELFVCFGGIPAKNSQVAPGGATEHRVPGALRRLAQTGVRFVNVSPTRDNLETGGPIEWWPIRPNTDTALMLGLAHTLHAEGLCDRAFLQRYCVGFERFEPYLTGEADGQPKDAAWASAITDIPAERIVSLAREMKTKRTMLNASWSLQRAHHGEQPFFMLVTLAAMLGQIGLPGGGFGLGYGATNTVGSHYPRFDGPSLSQGTNAVRDFIPVARIADMLLNPGEGFTYDGVDYTYPDIRLVHWAGGNPFHHHQDLNRLVRAWRQPETVIVNEQFWNPLARMADIVLPATTTLEREDLGYGNRERHFIAMKKIVEPNAEARDDYAIFGDLAKRLGVEEAFTEGLDSRQWIERMYEAARERGRGAGVHLPPFQRLWDDGFAAIERANTPVTMLGEFRCDPDAYPLRTPSGKLELFSETVAGFGHDDCPGHPVWREPAEWLGAPLAAQFPLHMISDQPSDKLHSQYDHSPYSRGTKVAGRQPIFIHPADAAARGIVSGDVVRVFNGRGQCLAGTVVSDVVRPGVVRLSTGAWYDPVDTTSPNPLEKNGNPNVLTADRPASTFSQGCSAQTCLVQVEKFAAEAPPVTAYRLPEFEVRSGTSPRRSHISRR
jgi:biotin/methionine sulfoxide reductase